MFAEKCVCFFARRHFLSCGRRRSGCAAAKRKRAAAERSRMPTVARPSVPAARESAARPNGIFPQPKPAAGFVSARKSIAKTGSLLQKHGGIFRVSCSCRLCAARVARTRRRWPVRGAVSRIAAARTCLRSARGNMRGKESKNHKRISTAFQPLRRRRQSKSESPPNRIDVCIPIHRLYNKRKVPKLSRPRRGKCTRTLCGSAISTKSRVLPRRRHGKIV